MKKNILLLIFLAGKFVSAQVFLSSGMIEFEVRTNNHKVFGDGIWADMAKSRFPQFSTTYYQFIFKDDMALYKFDRYDEKSKIPWNNRGEEDNIWFNDYRTGTFTDLKFVFDDMYLLADSLTKINWKVVPNETREIMGFNCRKAVGIVFDSVYVFAFYTDEISISGGPMGISGLPGMILGITIPRMHTSWIATTLKLSGFDEKMITAPTKGKKKVAKELQVTVQKATKNWGTYGQRAVWQIFL
jgi:GLPGLI family protein